MAAVDTDDTALTYTVPQTARVLQISPTQVRRMVADGTLRTVPGVGRRHLISKAWLAQWVETANASGRPKTGTSTAHAGHAAPATGGTGRGDTGLKGGSPSAARPDTPGSTADHPEQPLRVSA